MNSLGFVFTFLALAALCQAANNENTKEMEQEEVKVDGEKLEYAKGSACGYCSYCKVSGISQASQELLTFDLCYLLNLFYCLDVKYILSVHLYSVIQLI